MSQFPPKTPDPRSTHEHKDKTVRDGFDISIANTVDTDFAAFAPEKRVPESPEADADGPLIEKGSERGPRGEILRPSERESPSQGEI